MIALDNLDRSIITLLVKNKNFTASDISRSLKVSQSKIWRRIKKLTDLGALTGKKVLVDRKKLGFGVTVFFIASEHNWLRDTANSVADKTHEI